MTTVAAAPPTLPVAPRTETAAPPVTAASGLGELVDRVRRLGVGGPGACPPGVDAQEWSQEVLRDLALLAELLDGATARLSGRHNDALTRHARSLAVVIDAHRSLVAIAPRR